MLHIIFKDLDRHRRVTHECNLNREFNIKLTNSPKTQAVRILFITFFIVLKKSFFCLFYKKLISFIMRYRYRTI